jgi:hypothetical protein
MLFPDVSNWNYFSIGVCDAVPEYSFCFKYALAVVTQCSMSKVSEHFFAGVKPVMYGDVVSSNTFEDACG